MPIRDNREPAPQCGKEHDVRGYVHRCTLGAGHKGKCNEGERVGQVARPSKEEARAPKARGT